MTYVPQKYIVVSGTTLTESTDLTVLLSTLIQKEAYLVVTQGALSYPLSIGKILLFNPGINTSLPLSSAFTSLLTDLFVSTYTRSSIPTLMSSGYYANRLKVFNPISYKEYQVSYTSTNTPDDTDVTIMRGYLDDLVITSTDDLSNALIAVNGVFHKTTLLDGKLYVIDGNRTLRISSGRKDVTLVDTTNIGGHTIIPLTTSNVTHTVYNDIARVAVGSSIQGKTVCAVIDGYWYHIGHDVVRPVTTDHLFLYTNLMPLIQQFRHNPRTMYQTDVVSDSASQYSRRYTDTYETLFIGNRSVPTSTFETVAFQLSRLTAFHSFLVVFNNPNIFTIEREVLATGTPKFYYDYADESLSGMASYGCGLCPSYLIHKETGGRRQIFIDYQGQYDMDYQMTNLNPSFIPAPIPDPKATANIALRFIDYVVA